MPGRNLAFLITLALLSAPLHATDLRQNVSEDGNVEDVLGASTASGNSPFLVDGESSDNVEKSKAQGEDYIFNHGVKEVSDKVTPKKKYEDFGYTLPGTYEKQENYIELDKLKMAKDFRKASTGGLNISFIKNLSLIHI